MPSDVHEEPPAGLAAKTTFVAPVPPTVARNVVVPERVAPAGAVNVSLSVAELLPGVGSVTPAGAVTVAVLESVPVAEAEIVQLAV